MVECAQNHILLPQIVSHKNQIVNIFCAYKQKCCFKSNPWLLGCMGHIPLRLQEGVRRTFSPPSHIFLAIGDKVCYDRN